MEAGYKCANPVCRNVLALEVHHIVWVKEGGRSTVDNLLALCGHCHDLHTAGHIPRQAIDAWKSLLVSLNNPSRASVDLLLVLYEEECRVAEDGAPAAKTPPFRFTGDGLGTLAPLITSGLVQVSRRFSGAAYFGGGMPSFEVRLTDRGRQLVGAWRKGDAAEVKRVLELPR
ncbi:MAG: HNH endonuclease [Nitrospiraceae bacterium]